MSGRRLPLSALLSLASLLSACSDDAPATDVCSMQQAPADARRIAGHAFELRVWPASVPAGYDGCQRAWMEDGRVFATTTFRGGKVQTFVLKEPKSEERRCVYVPQPTTPRPHVCPAAEEFPLWK